MRNRKQSFPESTTAVPYVNGTGAAIASGAVVWAGNRWGIAVAAIAIAGSGVLQTDGVFALAKATGGGTALAQGDRVAWDVANLRVGKVGAVDGVYIGRVNKAAGTADTTVEVVLDTAPLIYIKHTVTAGEDSANSVDINTQLGVALSGVASVQVENTSNVRRAPAGAVTLLTSTDIGKVRVVDANFAVNEVIHLLVAV